MENDGIALMIMLIISRTIVWNSVELILNTIRVLKNNLLFNLNRYLQTSFTEFFLKILITVKKKCMQNDQWINEVLT